MSDQWTAPGSDRPEDDRRWTPTGGEEAAPLFPGQAPPPASGPYGVPPAFPGQAPVAYPPGQPPFGAPPPYGVPPQQAQPMPGPMPGPAPGWRAGLEFRPGIIPLRPLQLGDIYGGVTKAIRGNVAATMGLAALISLVVLVPLTALGALVGNMSSAEDLMGDELPIGMLGQYVPLLGTYVTGILLPAFMAYVIGQGVLGRKVGPGETARGTLSRLLAVLGSAALVILITLLLYAVFGLPIYLVVVALVQDNAMSDGAEILLVLVVLALVGVLILLSMALQTLLTFALPAVVLERVGPVRSITRSAQLVGPPNHKMFWRVFGIRLLTGIMVSALSQIITFPAAMVGMLIIAAAGAGEMANPFMWVAIMQGVVTILVSALTTPFLAGVDALLFVDARIRKEGLDVQLMQATAEGATPPWARATGAGVASVT